MYRLEFLIGGPPFFTPKRLIKDLLFERGRLGGASSLPLVGYLFESNFRLYFNRAL